MPFRRVVVKVGTNLLTAGTDRLDLEVMSSLVGQIARLRQRGAQVVLVSSGAVAAGKHRLGQSTLHEDLPQRQVWAAVGQSLLMEAYDQLFRWHDITTAQALLTRVDLQNRVSYLNARNTFLALLQLGVVPIVNENDVVAVDELADVRIGDNDNLSAMVASLVEADVLVLLTDIDGLYSADPKRDPEARLVPLVDHIDAVIEASAGTVGSSRGIGGMVTKLQAAKLATASGVAVIIANGQEPDVLLRLADGEPLGTLFSAASSRMESRKRWMLAGLTRRGSVQVDSGAAAALRNRNTSLLPAGIAGVVGEFRRGDVVALNDAAGAPVAYGIVNYDSDDLVRVKGLHSGQIQEVLGRHFGDEVVHRDNLMLL
ncbi:MAG: glutamate 5-kinase [Dehalococcoidia bacterium]|nr:glutamate 5-kinase [Dehalococcoidia bacterium]